MLSWGWNSQSNTSNSEYGRFDFGTTRMRQPANGFDLRQGNNTAYIHQTPNSNAFHTPGCPHAHQYFPPQNQNHQPGCQHWAPTTHTPQEQDQGDSSFTPKFTVEVGNTAAAAALGGNVTLQGHSQYYMPESPNISEGGNGPLHNPKEKTEQNGEEATMPIPNQTQSAYELGQKSSGQFTKKSPLKKNMPWNSASMSATNIQTNKSQKKNALNAPRFKLCGRCPKCKIIQEPNQGPLVATFPTNSIGRNRKLLDQNFMNLEGKNFKAPGNR